MGSQHRERIATTHLLPHQFCRVITNVVSLFLPRMSHLTGSVVGLAGFALVLGTDKDNLACCPSCTSKEPHCLQRHSTAL